MAAPPPNASVAGARAESTIPGGSSFAGGIDGMWWRSWGRGHEAGVADPVRQDRCNFTIGSDRRLYEVHHLRIYTQIYIHT